MWLCLDGQSSIWEFRRRSFGGMNGIDDAQRYVVVARSRGFTGLALGEVIQTAIVPYMYFVLLYIFIFILLILHDQDKSRYFYQSIYSNYIIIIKDNCQGGWLSSNEALNLRNLYFQELKYGDHGSYNKILVISHHNQHQQLRGPNVLQQFEIKDTFFCMFCLLQQIRVNNKIIIDLQRDNYAYFLFTSNKRFYLIYVVHQYIQKYYFLILKKNNLKYPHRNMKNIIILTTLISLLSQSQALHSFSSLSKLTPSQLDKDNRIQIQDTLSPGITNLNSHSYIIKQIHKDKRQAYLLIRQKNKLVQNILKTNHLVPNEQSIVKSQIKPEYLSHQRKWSFTTIFAIFGTEGQLQKCFRIFNRLKIHRLKTVPSIAYLNQKRMVIQVFNSAKNKLNKALTTNFKDFQIKEVEDIEIKGIEMSNSDMFERHLQEEQNSSEEKVISNKDIEMMNEEVPSESISIKIIFKVGRVDHQENSSEEKEEGNEFHEQFDEDQSDYSDNSL